MRALLLVAAALPVAGCLPARDNPLDSANSPAPVLVVVDRTGALGCETEDPLENWPTVPAAFRGTCLALDARDTTDPQGTGVADLRFTYERIASEANPVPVGTPYLEDVRGASFHLLSPADVQAFPVGAETAFRVTVRDGGGATGKATIRMTMLNRAPIADADPLRILALAGPGSSEDVDFHATATDPDGDEITAWRWTDSAGVELATTSNHTASFSTESVSRHVLWVEAFDGVAWSERSPTPVRVGRAALWAARDSADDGTIEGLARAGDRRIHRTFFQGATPFDSTYSSGVDFHTSGTQTRVAVVAQQLLLLEWPSLDVLDAFDPAYAYDPTGLRFDDDGRIWIGATPYTDGSSNTVREVSGFDTAGDVLTPITPAFPKTVPATFPESGNSNSVFLDTDTDGNLWAVGEYEEALWAFDPSPAATLLLGSSASPSGSVYKGLARRPESPGMWAVQGQSFVGSEPAQSALLHLVVGQAGIARTELPLDADDVDGLVWVDADRFWTSIAVHGLCLVNATILEAGGSLEAAIEIAYPSAVPFTNVVSDPVSGDAWWSSVFGSLVARTSIFGDIDVFSGSATMNDIDPDGGIWFVADPIGGPFGTLTAGEAPSYGSIAAEVATGAFSAVPDGQGGLWVATVVPRALQRVASNGEIIDVIARLDRAEGITTVPTVMSMGFDGDHTLVIAGIDDVVEPFSFLRVDLSNRTPFSEAPAPAELSTEFQSITYGRVFVPPAGVGEHFFWVDLISQQIQRTDAQGTTSPVLSVSAYDSWDAAISTVDGRLCVIDVNGVAADLYSISAAGVATLTTSLTFALPPERVGVSSSLDAATGEERCWVGIREIDTFDFSPQLRVLAYNETGTYVQGYLDDDGEAVSIAALGSDSLWVVRNVGGEQTLEAVEWDRLGNVARIPFGPAGVSSFVKP